MDYRELAFIYPRSYAACCTAAGMALAGGVDMPLAAVVVMTVANHHAVYLLGGV
jgi:hypothetical protein